LKNEQKIQKFDHIFDFPDLNAMKFEIIQEYKQGIHILKYWELKILFTIFQFEMWSDSKIFGHFLLVTYVWKNNLTTSFLNNIFCFQYFNIWIPCLYSCIILIFIAFRSGNSKIWSNFWIFCSFFNCGVLESDSPVLIALTF